MIWAERNNIKEMNHLNTIYDNDILLRYFQIFFISKLSHWNGGKSFNSNSITQQKRIFNVNTFILFIKHIYLMLIGKVPTARYFLMSIANPVTRSAMPSPKRLTR